MNISIFTSIHNRAHLLKWCLAAVHNNALVAGVEVELNVMNSGSTDGLDEVLRDYSNVFQVVKKWDWDRTRTAVPNPFGCPAERYNVLVKLCSHDILWKTDPEMVILDPFFLRKSLCLIDDDPNSFVMPFPYHCYEFPVGSLNDIKNNYRRFHYPTHITKENARDRMVYYQAVFRRESYLKLGGIDERFIQGVGSEDEHFLSAWKKEYGTESFVPLVDSPVCHLYHGGMAESPDKGPVGVPPHLYPWVKKNEILRKQLSNVLPNTGKKWGTIYPFLKKEEWKNGTKLQ